MIDNRGLFWANGTMFYKVYDLSPVPRIDEKIFIGNQCYIVKDISYSYIDIDVNSEVDGQIDINIELEAFSK